jgi:hypothetical protein
MKNYIEGAFGIKFWMQRVAEEHIRLAKQKMDRVGLLAFQSFNINKMTKEIQEKVIEDLFKDIREVFSDQSERIIKEISQEQGDKI